jgi:hypothetical protein
MINETMGGLLSTSMENQDKFMSGIMLLENQDRFMSGNMLYENQIINEMMHGLVTTPWRAKLNSP